MRLREPVLIALLVFVVILITDAVGDPWATAGVYAMGAGLALLIYGGRNGG